MGLKRIDPKKRIVLDVDTQRHFFDKNNSICIERSDRIKHNIESVLAWAWVNHIPIISTIQMHSQNNSIGFAGSVPTLSNEKLHGTQRGKVIRFQARDITDLPLNVLDHYDQLIFDKRTYNPFDEPRLDRFLTNLRVDEILLMGCPKEGAILATLLGLQARKHCVTVITDAVGTLAHKLELQNREHMNVKSENFIRTQTLVKQYIPLTLAI